MKIIKRGFLNFKVRNNTLDEWIVDEVLTEYNYIKPLEINSKDVILDIGMNIGVFSVIANSMGADVYGYEPDPENYKLANDNILLNNLSVKTINKGISNKNKEVLLYLNEKKNRGTHSTIKIKGRRRIKIKCENINEVLKEIKPNKLKIDCEGEEHKIIMCVDNWYNVNIIRMEWHRRLLKDEVNIKFHDMINKLENDGFIVKAKRDAKGWTQMITAIKK